MTRKFKKHFYKSTAVKPINLLVFDWYIGSSVVLFKSFVHSSEYIQILDILSWVIQLN